MMVLSGIKSWLANLTLYGVSLGLLLAALQFSKYRFFILGNAEEWHIGLVATLFAAVGIWAGIRWARPLTAKPATFRPPAEVVAQLGITPRELEVLEQIALGLSNQEIAEKLFVSLNTVKTHSSNLFSKLRVQRRTQAIQEAKKLGLIA